MISILYFKSVIPNDDYTLNIVFGNDTELKFPMMQLLKQFRFSPLQNKYVWKTIEIYPTHLEWNEGTFQVAINIEEITPNYLNLHQTRQNLI